MDINDVIDGFKECAYDDLGASLPFLKHALNESVKDPMRLNGIDENNYEEHVRSVILSELMALKKAIPEQYKGQFFIISDDVGYKFGHFNVMKYILARWYLPTDPVSLHNDVNANKKCSLWEPVWFMQCITLLNNIPRWKDQLANDHWNSVNVLNKLIEYVSIDETAEGK